MSHPATLSQGLPVCPEVVVFHTSLAAWGGELREADLGHTEAGVREGDATTLAPRAEQELLSLVTAPWARVGVRVDTVARPFPAEHGWYFSCPVLLACLKVLKPNERSELSLH